MLNPEDQVWLYIQFAARRHASESARLVALQEKITEPEAIILLVLHVQTGLTQNDLAARLARDKTTVSRTLSKLEEMGLIIRSIGSLDGRSREIALTERGHRAVAASVSRLRNDVRAATRGLSDADLVACYRVITLLATH